MAPVCVTSDLFPLRCQLAIAAKGLAIGRPMLLHRATQRLGINTKVLRSLGPAVALVKD